MRHALGVLGVLAAAVLLAVSAAMNWKFGFGLGKSELESHLLGGASAAADCLKALIPFFLFAAVRRKSWSQVLAAGLLWVICLGYSMTSSLGFAALNRNDTTGGRELQASAYSDLRKEHKRLEDRLSWMPQHRPAAMIEEEIARGEKDRHWATTKGCTDVPGKTTREFCQGISQLRAELAVALEAATVDQRLTQVRSKLDKQAGNSIVGEADPQASVIARVSGLDVGVIQISLTLLLSLLLEVGSALGFYVATSAWRVDDREPAPMPVAQPKVAANENRSIAASVEPVAKLTAPETDVERFHKERITKTEGSSVTATTLYEDYCGWCEEREKEPMAFPTFGRQFGELGVQKAKLGGRIRYIGIKLNSALTGSEDDDSLAIGQRLGGGAGRPQVSRVA